MEVMEAAPLDAAVAVVRGILEIADQVRDAPVLDRDLQAAGRVAEAADAGGFHEVPLVAGDRRRMTDGRRHARCAAAVMGTATISDERDAPDATGPPSREDGPVLRIDSAADQNFQLTSTP